MWGHLWRTWRIEGEVAVAAGGAAFAVTLLAMALLIRLAPALGLMDRPTDRKTHAEPTPAVGGLAIALGCLPVAILVCPSARPIEALALAALLLLVAGVWDDLYQLHWTWRLGAHVAAALILVMFGGVQVNSIGAAFGIGDFHQLGGLAAPFTVLAAVGLINALNMADGVDGLAGAIGLTALGMLTAAALYAGNGELVAILVLLMGGLAAFLTFNLRTPWARARAFLGNAGSDFLGLCVAWACFRLTQTPAHPVSPVLAPFLVAIPVIDCLVLMARRMRSGRSPFSADRNHLHHLLTEAGCSATAVVGLVAGAGLMIGLAAAIALVNHVPQPLFIVAFVLMLVGYFALTAKRTVVVALLARLTSTGGLLTVLATTVGWAPSSQGNERAERSGLMD